MKKTEHYPKVSDQHSLLGIAVSWFSSFAANAQCCKRVSDLKCQFMQPYGFLPCSWNICLISEDFQGTGLETGITHGISIFGSSLMHLLALYKTQWHSSLTKLSTLWFSLPSTHRQKACPAQPSWGLVWVQGGSESTSTVHKGRRNHPYISTWDVPDHWPSEGKQRSH